MSTEKVNGQPTTSSPPASRASDKASSENPRTVGPSGVFKHSIGKINGERLRPPKSRTLAALCPSISRPVPTMLSAEQPKKGTSGASSDNVSRIAEACSANRSPLTNKKTHPSGSRRPSDATRKALRTATWSDGCSAIPLLANIGIRFLEESLQDRDPSALESAPSRRPHLQLLAVVLRRRAVRMQESFHRETHF